MGLLWRDYVWSCLDLLVAGMQSDIMDKRANGEKLDIKDKKKMQRELL